LASIRGNKYLIDGYFHRMKLSERWHCSKTMKAKWEAHPASDGAQSTGYGSRDANDISAMRK